MFEEIYAKLLSSLDAGNRTVLITELKLTDNNTKEIVDKYIITQDEIENNVIPKNLKEYEKEIEDSFNCGTPESIKGEGFEFVLEPFFPKPRVVIFGGGHIAKPLVDLSADSEFSVTVVDDRPAFANAPRFPKADEVICDSFENAFDRVKLRRDDFVVIVTRGHKHDNVCLRNALKCKNLAFLGMIGSRKRVRDMINDFKAEGYTDEDLAHLNSPIGLNIGAVTPFEIAISIVAQLIEYRRIKSNMAKGLPRRFNWPEFDRDVITALSQKEDMDKALITVTMSKGSVPRKAGAKMLVYPDGRIMGSIGGGCSEADVITTARDLIRDKGCIEQRIDMTNEEAEEHGMACGGIMDVLIEAF